MFDHLIWWQVVLVLGPLVAVMHLIRYREQAAGQSSFASLSRQQKGWLVFMLLPPGAAATLMGGLETEELRAYLDAGAKVRGNGRNLAEPVLKEFLSQLPSDLQKGEASELSDRLAEAVQQDASTVLSVLRTGSPSLTSPAQELH